MNSAASRPTLVRFGTAVVVAIAALSLILGASVFVAQSANGASKPSVKILGKKLLKQSATGGGNTKALLKTGGVQHRAVCTDQGGGKTRLDIQVKSGKSGGKFVSRLGLTSLTSSWQTMWSVFGNGVAFGFAEGYDVLYKDGTFRHFQLDFMVNTLGAKCVSRIVATSA